MQKLYMHLLFHWATFFGIRCFFESFHQENIEILCADENFQTIFSCADASLFYVGQNKTHFYGLVSIFENLSFHSRLKRLFKSIFFTNKYSPPLFLSIFICTFGLQQMVHHCLPLLMLCLFVLWHVVKTTRLHRLPFKFLFSILLSICSQLYDNKYCKIP